MTQRKLFNLLEPFLATCLGLFLGLLIIGIIVALKQDIPEGTSVIFWHQIKTVFIAGFDALYYLYVGAFGNKDNFGYTIFYSIPLIFTGLSVALAFQAGLFNVGAQGQLIIASLFSAIVAISLPNMPSFIAFMLIIITSFVSGAFFGFIPGLLKAKTGAHEVITTIMLNYIASGLAIWFTLQYFKNPHTQNPETREVNSNYLLSHLQFNNWSLFGEAPVSTALFIALLVSLCVWILLYKTSLGYKIRMVGNNEHAAKIAGINSDYIKILALTIAGGIAGFVALNEVFSNGGKYKHGISDFGFMGIEVALLGRSHPFGVILAAFLFGALHKGSMELEFSMDYVTQEISVLLRALVILSVSADGFWFWLRQISLKKRKMESL